jgi:hypothetical protein
MELVKVIKVMSLYASMSVRQIRYSSQVYFMKLDMAMGLWFGDTISNTPGNFSKTKSRWEFLLLMLKSSPKDLICPINSHDTQQNDF